MPLIVDPALQAAVIRQFNLRGELAPFNLTENVIPTFDIGRITGFDPTVVTTTAGQQGIRIGTVNSIAYLPVGQPDIGAAGVFDGGVTINPAAGAVIADGGPVGGTGRRSVRVQMSGNAVYDFQIQWRDAANLVNLATWTILAGGASPNIASWERTINLTLNERVRVVVLSLVAGSVSAFVDHQPVTASVAV